MMLAAVPETIIEEGRLADQHSEDGKPERSNDDQRHGPSDRCREAEHRHRRDGPAEVAAERVDAIGAAESALADRRLENGVVGWMEDAVTGSGDQHADSQKRIA